MDANPDGAKDENEDKRDAATKRREDFLNIYKEDKGGNDGADDDTPDLSNGIKFKRDPDETEEDFKMRTSKENESNKKPLIQEISASTNDNTSAAKP